MTMDNVQFAITRDKDYLEHHGIKGQKWGVRRYENEDGTLTEAGKARYAEAKRIAEKGSITGSDKLKNAMKRGAIGGAVGATIAGGITYDPGSKITNKTHISVEGFGDVGSRESSYFRPGKGLDSQATAAGFLAGYAATAVGSFIKDSVHNQRVKNAEKFIQEYQEAYNKTYGGGNSNG